MYNAYIDTHTGEHEMSSVTTAVQVLSRYSTELAQAFSESPHRRVSLALAFAAGFEQPEESDPTPDAQTVLEAAFLDQARRQN